MTYRAYVLALLLTLALSIPSAFARPVVVAALFDGLAPAMVRAASTPALDALARDGAFSEHLVPEFPTVSNVNHTTFTTGCRPAQHGIVGNAFIDPERGRYSQLQDADWMTGCATLPEVAEAQGIRTAVLGFTCRFSTRRGPLASHVSPEPHQNDFPDDVIRARQVADLLRLPPDERPGLILVYFSGSDEQAHDYGLTHPNTVAAVERIDAAVAILRQALEALRPESSVRLLIATDHGMAPADKLVNIARLLRKHDIAGRAASSGSTSYIYLDDPADAPRVAAELRGYDAFEVFERGHHPPYAHLGTGPRVGDILLSARRGYYIEDADKYPWYAHLLGITWIWPAVFSPPFGGISATHGYPPDDPDMHGVFYAWGDGIGPGTAIGALRMLDIHPTLAAWLGIAPGADAAGAPVSDLMPPPAPGQAAEGDAHAASN